MGDILDFCQNIVYDDNLEGVLVPQKDHLNNSRLIKKRKSDINIKELLAPLNSTEENNASSSLKLKNGNKNINIEDKYKINSKFENINGEENNSLNSINKLNHIIESLEKKNKILEKEKNEIKKENEKLIKEIKMYKDTISKFRKKSSDKNDYSLEMNDKSDNNIAYRERERDRDKDEKIKVIFLFKNNKDLNQENREEIMAFRYEMFIEVKLRLLNIRHLGPRDLKSCFYNSKEINDWFTLEELNIDNNSYVICEYA
jgi:hypothetical protein